MSSDNRQSIVGRYGNRIANAKFTLGGATYPLNANDGANTLHGGPCGFYKVLWTAREVPAPKAAALQLTYLSPDGEEGFPGNLEAQVTYTIGAQNELRIDYKIEVEHDLEISPKAAAEFTLFLPYDYSASLTSFNFLVQR